MDLDLTEAFGVGAVFEECVFRHAKLNASVHTDAAFMNCTFTRSTFFDVRFERCKLIGSRFEDCTWDIAKVEGGNWSFVVADQGGPALGVVHRACGCARPT